MVSKKRTSATIAAATALGLGMLSAGLPLSATAGTDEVLQQMRSQLEAMQQRIAELETAQKEEKKSSDWSLNSKALKFYGQARVSIDHQSGNGRGAGTNGTSIVSNASRFGVKGAIASGLKDTNLIYQAEMRYETTDSVNGTAGKSLEFREGYAGLAGKSWGKVRLGRLSTSYKTALTKIDPWNDNAPQSRAGGRQGTSELHSSYFNNAFDYTTPKFGGGFTGSVWFASEFTNDANPLHNTGTLRNYTGGSASGGGIRYVSGPLFVAADVVDVNADAITRAGLTNGSGWELSARYKFGAFSIAGMIEDVENLGLGKNRYINGIYKFGKTRLIVGYGTNSGSTAYGANTDSNNFSIGAKYALNKKSELFAAYNTRENENANTELNTLTLGINAKFGY